jgi:hypothetical protein
MTEMSGHDSVHADGHPLDDVLTEHHLPDPHDAHLRGWADEHPGGWADEHGSAESGWAEAQDHGFGGLHGDAQVVGDPVAAEAVWHQQEHQDTCAVASQEFVLEELTGVPHSEQELATVAAEHGWYTPGGGTPGADVGNLLAYYGVPVHQELHATIGQLHDALASGEKCIVGVNAAQLAARDLPPGAPLTAYPGVPGQEADHAVEVIGIDGHDPDHLVVILNDPGVPDGAGERVPMDVFLDSWASSDNFLVTAGPGVSP